MDELLIAFVDPLRERNRAHRAAGEAWIAALASRDEAGARRAIEKMQALAVEGARESLRLKRDLFEALRPETRALLAERYPRLLATSWVRGNRLVDTTDLSKWSGRAHPESAAGEGDSANP